MGTGFSRFALTVGFFVSFPLVESVAQTQAIPGTTREQVQQSGDRIQAPQVDPRDAGQIQGSTDQDAGQPLNPDSSFTFALRGINVQGATVYGEDDLAPIYESFLNTEVTIGGLREIGNRIEQLYRDDGYVATRVILPPQAIKDGVPTLEVFEGKIIHYEVNGEIGPVKKQIAALLDNLLTDEPARWTDLERYLLLARDLPGISLTGTLRSAGDSAPGGVILVVDTARKAVDGFASFQNRNAVPTGPFTISGGAALNSNTEYAERVGAVALLALEVPEQVTGLLTYQQNLGSDGLVFRGSYTTSFSEPKDELRDLGLSTISTIINLELEYPLVRSRKFSLWTRGGIEYLDQHSSIGNDGGNGTVLFDDQLRVMYAGAKGIWLPPLGGITEFNVVVRQGIEGFGASGNPNSRPDAVNDYTILKGDISHRQPFLSVFELYGGFEGQLADSPLPSIEEMSLGELTVGRGFEPGSLTGDAGFGFVTEIRYNPPGVEAWWLDSFQVYGFFDYARVYDRGNPTGASEGFEELSSGGFGVRFQVFETIFGDVYYAQPTTRALSTSERKPNPTVKFTLTKFF